VTAALLQQTSRYHSTTASSLASSAVVDVDDNALSNDKAALADLFSQYAKKRDGKWTLSAHDVSELLEGIGRGPSVCSDNQVELKDCGSPTSPLIEKLFTIADKNGDGLISMRSFLANADLFLNRNPAGIILAVGGPGSGKGLLSDRLQAECNVVHLSSGKLLRDEVKRGSELGKQVSSIMARGELVSSAIMVALIKQVMKSHAPGKRVLLDGFPRSLENAHDLVTLCGRPQLALHLVCDDTVLMERIMRRQENRADDNFETALERIRTYHKYHNQTMEWLRLQHVPIVNLDCGGSPESVWQQLVAIGKLMRPVVKLDAALEDDDEEDFFLPIS